MEGRIESERRGLGLTMIEELDRYDFNGNFLGPSSCPMRYCQERFTQCGVWALHAIFEHVSDLVPGRRVDGAPPELRQQLAERYADLLRLWQRNNWDLKHIEKEWDEATEDERARIQEAWMGQLRTDLTGTRVSRRKTVHFGSDLRATCGKG